jgi:malonyl-CoA O-methyltransferase
MAWFRRKIRTLESVAAYALWAQSYPPHAHNALMQAEESAMLALMPALQGLRVLDLACGTGRYARYAQAQGAHVLGLDNSSAMLERASAVPVALATSEALPLARASVDVVLCGLAIGHLRQLKPTLKEIARVLKAGGSALISDVHPFQALRGAKRTFTAPDGRVYAVEHTAHSISDTFTQAQACGLGLSALSEPRLGDAPVVVVYRFVRA